MDRDWARLGEHLKAARNAAGIQQKDVAERIGLGRGAVRNIETGTATKITPAIRAYAKLVGWTESSVNAVLDGGEATLAAGADQAPNARQSDHRGPSDPEVDDLSVAVQAALREGPLLDSRVIRVRTPAGEVTATIIARGEDGMSRSERLEALKAWQASGPAIVDDVAIDGDRN